jgi:hypothetical protein
VSHGVPVTLAFVLLTLPFDTSMSQHAKDTVYFALVGGILGWGIAMILEDWLG